ncbi:helix-turn-helix domain-containing protein [Rathayibacter sp. AY2B5]|uniref:helix-turn-helix domain-containing protein n=1 Tax=Rathayibacter sp. AY2B5 TaxID=2080570 RepID=UPI000CE82C5A|nr:helix-turn-helix domain-containing protein [Rathayibacter sp. AY2B5]PPG38641.1 excisionase [Rathayibacter sp. AY2B5]
MAKHLTVTDLADELQIEEGAVYQMRNRNPDALPPAFKVGKYLRWRREDVDAWIAAQLPTSNVTPISGRRSA